MTISKQEALQRLGVLEAETKALRLAFTRKSENILDDISSFEDAFEIYDKEVSEDFRKLLFYEGECPEMIASRDQKRLEVIIHVCNEGWVADFSKGDRKHYPWMQYESGSGLSYYAYDLTNAFTYVGSRLCTKTSDLAKAIALKFPALYNSYMLQIK